MLCTDQCSPPVIWELICAYFPLSGPLTGTSLTGKVSLSAVCAVGLYMQAQENAVSLEYCFLTSRFLFLPLDASLTPASFILLWFGIFSLSLFFFPPCKNGKLTCFCLYHCLLGRRCLLDD